MDLTISMKKNFPTSTRILTNDFSLSPVVVPLNVRSVDELTMSMCSSMSFPSNGNLSRRKRLIIIEETFRRLRNGEKTDQSSSIFSPSFVLHRTEKSSRIGEHIRSHTQKKTIVSPHCQALLSSRGKFLWYCQLFDPGATIHWMRRERETRGSNFTTHLFKHLNHRTTSEVASLLRFKCMKSLNVQRCCASLFP